MANAMESRWQDVDQEATDELAGGERHASQVQQGRYLNCPNGSHMAMWDDQQTYVSGVVKFMRDVDGGGFKKD